jgi:FMN-dependent NADH-azoreductase
MQTVTCTIGRASNGVVLAEPAYRMVPVSRILPTRSLSRPRAVGHPTLRLLYSIPSHKDRHAAVHDTLFPKPVHPFFQGTLLKLLHIVATPRAQDSNTMRIATAFIDSLQSRYTDLDIDTIDLFTGDLPPVAGDNIETKYSLMTGRPIDKQHKESWEPIERLIEHFLSADIYLISVPMWNFSIPYALKYYIDSIVQPGYLFKYNEQGQPVGLIHDRKMVCVTSRGGDYSPASPFNAYDFQEPYLRAIFGFVGIIDMHFINAQPMDITPEIREVAVGAAIEAARTLAAGNEWDVTREGVVVEHPVGLKPRPLPV